MDFTDSLYQETSLLFKEGETEIMTARNDDGENLSLVRIVHRETSTSIDVDDFDTQKQNAIIARLRLHHLLQK